MPNLQGLCIHTAHPCPLPFCQILSQNCQPPSCTVVPLHTLKGPFEKSVPQAPYTSSNAKARAQADKKLSGHSGFCKGIASGSSRTSITVRLLAVISSWIATQAWGRLRIKPPHVISREMFWVLPYEKTHVKDPSKQSFRRHAAEQQKPRYSKQVRLCIKKQTFWGMQGSETSKRHT